MQHTISSVIHLTPADFQKVKAAAASHKGPGQKHADVIKSARNHGHLASMMTSRGGGFSKFVGSLVKAANPWHWKRTFQQWKHNSSQSAKMTPQDFEISHMVNQAYVKPGKRTARDGWEYQGADSDKNHAVYHRGDERMFAIRGTKDFHDLLPDVHIVAGNQQQSSDFQKTNKKLKGLMDKGGDWSVAGHSLGGTKAMWLAEQNGLKSYAFNPGFHAAADDVLDTEYEGHNVYTVHGDPVSNTILARPHSNLKVLGASSFNPLQNHAMSNFVHDDDGEDAKGGAFGTKVPSALVSPKWPALSLTAKKQLAANFSTRGDVVEHFKEVAEREGLPDKGRAFQTQVRSVFALMAGTRIRRKGRARLVHGRVHRVQRRRRRDQVRGGSFRSGAATVLSTLGKGFVAAGLAAAPFTAGASLSAVGSGAVLAGAGALLG